MWTTYNLAKTWKTRPSELLFIEDQYQAFCLDEAVAFLGNGIMNMLDEVTGDPSFLEFKRQQILARVLEVSEEEEAKLYQTPTPTIVNK